MSYKMNEELSVVHLNKHESTGGAAIAARRLHMGLSRAGVESTMLVERKSSDAASIRSRSKLPNGISSVLRFGLDTLRTYTEAGSLVEFTSAHVPSRVTKDLDRLDPDITHLHWIGDGYLSIEDIGKISQPIVWTLHDCWPFTGGCHYPNECRRFQSTCGSCPVLHSQDDTDLSSKTLQRKTNNWDPSDFCLVAPSTWMAKQCAQSTVFSDAQITVIPNGIDTNRYKPNRNENVQIVDDEDTNILFGALSATTNPRKGHDLLLQALTELESAEEYQCIVFGEDDTTITDSDLPVKSVGYLPEEKLIQLYSECDVMVVPSRYESFGQTAAESLACGTPVVAFDATGPSDIVDHKRTGYLAAPYDPADLASGIEYVLADPDRCRRLGEEARAKALREYNSEVVVKEYKDLYKSLLQSHSES